MLLFDISAHAISFIIGVWACLERFRSLVLNGAVTLTSWLSVVTAADSVSETAGGGAAPAEPHSWSHIGRTSTPNKRILCQLKRPPGLPKTISLPAHKG